MPVLASEARITVRGGGDVHKSQMGMMLLASIAKFNRTLKEKERRRRTEREAA